MIEGDGTFLSRWSRRKAQSRAVDVAPEVIPEVMPEVASDEPAPPPMPVVPAGENQAADAIGSSEVPLPAAERTAPPTPTLDDVERLTPDADFSPFVDRQVQPEVRNAAMKKLFTDPHFNVMDGLDVYIDDYNKTEPMPRQWLRQLVQARVLGLLDDEVEEQPHPDSHVALAPSHDEAGPADETQAADRERGADGIAGAQEASAAAPPPDTPRPHEDTDLQLQPHDAARHEGARAAADDDAEPRGR